MAIALQTSGVREGTDDLTQLRAAIEANTQAAATTSASLDQLSTSIQNSGNKHRETKLKLDEHADAAEHLGAISKTLSDQLTSMGVPVSALQEGYTHLSGAANALTGEHANLAVGLAATGAAIAVVGAVAVEKGVSGFLEMADSVRELTERTGASIATVQGFQYALGTVGESSDSADRALTIFSRNAGTLSDELEAGKAPAGHFADSLEKLGISAQAFVAASPDERIRMVADGFAKLGDDAPKAQIAMELFGRQGASLISVLSQGSAAIDEGTAKTAQFGATMTVEGEQKALAFHKSMADLNLVVTGFENEIGSAVIPEITDFAKWLATAAANTRDFTDALLHNPMLKFTGDALQAAGGLKGIAEGIVGAVNPALARYIEQQDEANSKNEKAAAGHDKVTKAQKDQASATDDLNKVTLIFSTGIEKGSFAAQQFDYSIAHNSESQSVLQNELQDTTANMNALAGTLGLTATGAGATGSAISTLNSMTTAAGKNAADAATFHEQLGKAYAFAGSSAEQQRNILAGLDAEIKSGDEGQKASAQSQKNLDEAVRATGASAAEHAVHVQAMNDAWQTASGSAGSVTAMFDEIQREAGDSSTKVQDLQSHILDLFSKPTQEELNLKAQIADVNAEMTGFQATLSNSNPALQHVAAMQKAYDQSVLTGQSLTAQNKALDALHQALADTGPEGASIAAGQQRYDKLVLTKQGLDANLQSLQAHDGALSANAIALQGNARTVGETNTAYGDFTRTVTTGSTDQHTAISGLTGDYNGLAGAVGHVTTAAGLLMSQLPGVGAALRGALNTAGLTGAVTAAGYQGGGGALLAPTTAGPVTQGFGVNGERGVDIGVPVGTPLVAGGAGKISAVTNQGQQGIGLSVTIDLGNGSQEVIGHLNEATVQLGQVVQAGQQIGLSGGEPGSPTSGVTTGPHAEVQVLRGGQNIDPMTLFSSGANAASAGAAAATAAVNSVFGGPLPDSWYQAIQANESTLPLPGTNGPQPMFGIVSSPYAVGTGTFNSGGTPEASASLGVGAGQTRQALFPSVGAGAQAFNAIWQKNPGAVAAAQAGDFPAFLQALVAGGYAGPGEGGQWPGQVLSHYQPGAGAPGTAPSTPGLSGFGPLPSPAPENATPMTPQQLQTDLDQANQALVDLGKQSTEVTTGIKQQLQTVTEADVTAALQQTQSAKTTAQEKLGIADAAEKTLINDINTGASPAQIAADKEVAASARTTATGAVNDWKQFATTSDSLSKQYATDWIKSYNAVTQANAGVVQAQATLSADAMDSLKTAGLGAVSTHQSVNDQMLASDTSFFQGEQRQALDAADAMQAADQQVLADRQAIAQAVGTNISDFEQQQLQAHLARDQSMAQSAHATYSQIAGAAQAANSVMVSDLATRRAEAEHEYSLLEKAGDTSLSSFERGLYSAAAQSYLQLQTTIQTAEANITLATTYMTQSTDEAYRQGLQTYIATQNQIIAQSDVTEQHLEGNIQRQAAAQAQAAAAVAAQQSYVASVVSGYRGTPAAESGPGGTGGGTEQGAKNQGPTTGGEQFFLRGPGFAVPRYALGTDYVPADMLAFLHRGEAVIPASQNTTNHATTSNTVNLTAQFTINALDASGVRAVIPQIMQELEATITRQALHGGLRVTPGVG